ncbi:MAG: hypothetical protein RI904_1377, partial [Pseudomonadota bacterium]
NIDACRKNRNFSFTRADILVWSELKAAVKPADRIYHLAAIVGVKKVLEDPRAVMATNIAATERVFRAVDEVNPTAKILVASSSEVYGFNENSGFSETDDVVLRSGGRLRWCYAITKLADEYLAYSFVKSSKLNVSIVRLFNTIGPSQTGKYGMVVPNFVSQAVRNIPVTIFGEGTQTRSFCDVRDTIRAFDLLMSCEDANGEIVNVGNDQEISITDLAKLVIARAHSTSTLHYQTYEEAYGEAFEDITHRRPILDKLHALTGFTPKWTLEQTLDDLIATERKKLQQ